MSAALLSASLTLAADRALVARQPLPTPTPVATTALPPRPPVEVVITSPEPLPSPTSLPPDSNAVVLRDLVAASNAQMTGMLLIKAERYLALATEALLANNSAQADGNLVAANASLDQALRYAPENVKPPISNERVMIGQVRADLEVNPRDLDEELRSMRERLLALVAGNADS